MKGFVQTALGKYEERDLPRPIPARGEVVLRMRVALTCGTDLKLLARGHPRIALPVTMGHEVCGEIAEMGEGVTGFRTGDRVVPGITGPCGECADCRNGRSNLCAAAHADRTWGAFAELVRVPASVVAGNLHRVPEGLSDSAAAFLDPVASVLHGWNQLRGPSGTLLVHGAGAIALLWVATARERGMRTVVVGRGPERLRLAAAMGAEVVELPKKEHPRRLTDAFGGTADVAVDCTGAPEVWERLPRLVRRGGEVLLFGGCEPGARVTFDAARLHYDEIALIGSFHYTPAEARDALALLASGRLDPSPLLTYSGGLSELPGFLDAQARGEGIRYAVTA
ncbi:MAG: zinc-binding dehydrogenase [Thermoanaerobaculia bacterium]